MGRQIHAQGRNTNRPEQKRKEFQGKKLETAVLKIKGSGKEFTGFVPEDAGVDERIERIAKQNGGVVKKKYYPEMKTYEITEIRIGNQLIAKNEEAGIHWGIEGEKIPLAVDDDGNITGFLNGKEIKSREISVWSEKSTLDPKNLKDLKGDKQKVESAHAAGREKDPDLKKSEVVLFDKETGELSPMQQARDAESFDYGEISMEKIFISEISAVENGQRSFFENNFDRLQDKGIGETFYSYIEIVDAKENIADRVIVANETMEMAPATAIDIETSEQIPDIPQVDENIRISSVEPVHPLASDYIADVPKPRRSRLSVPPDYFQFKPRTDEKPKVVIRVKKDVARKTDFRYPPKTEKPEIVKIKKTEAIPIPVPVREIPVKLPKISKIKPSEKIRKIKTKKKTKKRKKRRGVRKTSRKIKLKIKKMKNKIEEIVKEKKSKKIRPSIKKKIKTDGKKKKAKLKPRTKTKKHKKNRKLKTKATKTKKNITKKRFRKPKKSSRKKKKIKNKDKRKMEKYLLTSYL